MSWSVGFLEARLPARHHSIEAGQRALRERWLASLDRPEGPAAVGLLVVVPLGLGGWDVAEFFVESLVVVGG